MRFVLFCLMFTVSGCASNPASSLTDAQVQNAAAVCVKALTAGATITTIIIKENGSAPAVVTNGGTITITPDCATNINVAPPPGAPKA